MNRPIWEGIYPHWNAVPATGPGFEGDQWLERSLASARAERERYAAVASETEAGWARESPLTVAAAMISRGDGPLGILDFGGGIGSGYPNVTHSLADGVDLTYTVVETPAVCRAGAAFFQGDPRIQFISSLSGIPETDLVHIGSALQYIEHWEALLDRLCGLAATAMVFTDLMAGAIPTFATVQHYYDSDIPFWFFNLDAFTASLSRAGFRLALDSRFESTILGDHQPLPQDNFPESHRLGYARNQIWIRMDV